MLRRTSWLVLFLGFGAGAAGQEKSPLGLDAAGLKAWTDRGFEAGYIGRDAFGELQYTAVPDTLADRVPAMYGGLGYRRLARDPLPVGRLMGLPAPTAPFGLSLRHGNVPNDFEEVVAFDRLTHLILTGSELRNSDLEALAELKALTHLRVESPLVTGVGMKHLAGLGNLKSLDLSRTRVPGAWLPVLARIQSLEHITLNHGLMADDELRHLARFPRLTSFSVSVDHLTFGDTTHLGVSPSKQLATSGLRHLAQVKNLRALQLITPLDDEGVAHLTALPKLTVLSCSFSDKLSARGLKQIAELKNLERLDPGGYIPNELLEKLRKALPNCKIGSPAR